MSQASEEGVSGLFHTMDNWDPTGESGTPFGIGDLLAVLPGYRVDCSNEVSVRMAQWFLQEYRPFPRTVTWVPDSSS